MSTLCPLKRPIQGLDWTQPKTSGHTSHYVELMRTAQDLLENGFILVDSEEDDYQCHFYFHPGPDAVAPRPDEIDLVYTGSRGQLAYAVLVGGVTEHIARADGTHSPRDEAGNMAAVERGALEGDEIDRVEVEVWLDLV